MKRICIVAALLLPALSWGQNYNDVLAQIEQNNPELKALQAEAAARAREARTGLSPADPEVEAAYLWGKPKDMGNRVDLNVTQTFDFPTAYYWRKKVSDGNVDVAYLDYQVARRELMLEAESFCVEMVYRNALSSLLSKRLEMAEAVYASVSKKVSVGETNMIDLSKAEFNLISSRRSYEANAVELGLIASQLERLNGGKAVSVEADSFMPAVLPQDFDSWFSGISSPDIRALSRHEEVSRLGIKVEQSGWLPKFSVGYVSEHIAGTVLQGVGVGVSIPLWENHGKVKAAKAAAEAAKTRLDTEKMQFECSMKALFDKAVKLSALVESYRSSLESTESMDLLEKALDSGQISLLDFVVEQEVWYDAAEQLLESERELQIVLAELRSFDNQPCPEGN